MSVFQFLTALSALFRVILLTLTDRTGIGKTIFEISPLKVRNDLLSSAINRNRRGETRGKYDSREMIEDINV